MLRQQLAIRLNSVSVCTVNTHRFITLCKPAFVFYYFFSKEPFLEVHHQSPGQNGHLTNWNTFFSSLFPPTLEPGCFGPHHKTVGHVIIRELMTQPADPQAGPLLPNISCWLFHYSLAPFPESEQGTQKEMKIKPFHLFPIFCSGYKFSEGADWNDKLI
jgi:hypothetical protein